MGLGVGSMSVASSVGSGVGGGSREVGSSVGSTVGKNSFGARG